MSLTSWVFSTLFQNRLLILLSLSPRLWQQPKPVQTERTPVEVQEGDPAQQELVEPPPVAVEEAAPIAPIGPTLTHTWMTKQVEENGLDIVVTKKIQRMFPTFEFDHLLSDVRELMFFWASRGLCDQHIEKGKPPTPAILAVWAHQKMRQRAYKLATDACSRSDRGLLTQAEVRARKTGKRNFTLSASNMAPNKVAPKKDESGNVSYDVVAPLPEDPDYPDGGFDLAKTLIQVSHPKAAEKFLRVAEYLEEGKPIAEVAVLEGCSQLTVKHMFQKVRSVFHETPNMLKLCLSLLNSIEQEPYSTLEDLQEENPDKDVGELETALSFLKVRGLVRERKGSFLQTVKGKDCVLLGEIL